ncbi:MAG: hypothetical protein LBN39_03105 [Planctomycetaceae bacterium]|jgi:hypothetical protein|nr:hypothetical protein [Planctomycetaceae bacterium]
MDELELKLRSLKPVQVSFLLRTSPPAKSDWRFYCVQIPTALAVSVLLTAALSMLPSGKQAEQFFAEHIQARLIVSLPTLNFL